MGIGGTSSSQSVSAEPRLADRDGVGSRTCGLMPTGDVRYRMDSVEERPLSAAKLSAESQTHIWHRNPFSFPSEEYSPAGKFRKLPNWHQIMIPGSTPPPSLIVKMLIWNNNKIIM